MLTVSWGRRCRTVARTRAARARWDCVQLFFVAILPIAILAGAPTSTFSESIPERHVLVLLSDQESRMAAETDLIDGLRETLSPPHADHITLHMQSLEVEETPRDAHDHALVLWLRERFRVSSIDVVVSVGVSASTFAARYADSIWPRVAVAFVAVDEAWVAATERPARSVPIIVHNEYLSTAHTALMLVPGAHRIVLVSDGAINRRRDSLIHQQLSLLPTPADILDLTDAPRDELALRLHSLMPSDVILAITPLPGAASHTRPGLAEVAKRADRPMFTVDESLVGEGAVGGLVMSYGNVGRRSGVLVQRLLDGADPARMQSTIAADTAWVFDQRQLTRWKLDDRNLPAGSDVRFRDSSLSIRLMLVSLILLTVLAGVIGRRFMVSRPQRPPAVASAQVPQVVTEFDQQRNLHDLAHMNMISAMGEVAASVAHELNQPLTAVLSNAQAARRLLTGNSVGAAELREILDDIIEQDKRAGDVIQGMRRIMKKDQFEWVALDMRALVTDVVHLLAHQAAWHGVLLLTEFGSGQPKVRGDRVQLQQVILNLVLNGIEASRVEGGARRRCVSIVTRLEGKSLRLSVRDSGNGIPADADERLFEPFFTTKRNGLGMGLSISRSIVELHRGEIRARNVPGGGAEFSVVLPLEEGDAA